MSVVRSFASALIVLLAAGAFGACAEIKSGAEAVTADAGADATTGRTKFEVVRSLGSGASLTSVWGFDDLTMFAVGVGGLKYTCLDGTWLRTTISQGRNYAQVWGLKRNDVYAVGEISGSKKGFIERFDGEKWNDEFTADTPLYSVWGDGQVVLAVGPGGKIFGREAKRGATWAQRGSIKEPDVPNFVAVTGNGPSNLTLLGEKRIYHTNNYGDFPWFEPTVDPSSLFMTAWGGPGSDTNVFIGMNHLAIAWMYSPGKIPNREIDASSLIEPDAGLEDINLALLSKDERDPDSASLFIRGIHGEGNKRYFVGDRGRMYTFDVLKTDVTTIDTGTNDSLFGVWASKEYVWVVGAHELVMRAPRALIDE